ncbi:MAG: hydrolase [Syntrophales bacterium]|nr:hydrolase [Syntrophales bacterium]
MLERENCLLLIIDIQGNLFLAMHNRDSLLTNVKKLINGIRILNVPIICTEQIKIGATVPELTDLMPDVKPIVKSTFSCCGDSNFMKIIHANNRKQVILCGIEAHVCVYQTALDLLKIGYEVHLVADAVASRSPLNREVGIQRMVSAGAMISSTEMVLFELLKTADDPRAKDIFQIIK